MRIGPCWARRAAASWVLALLCALCGSAIAATAAGAAGAAGPRGVGYARVEHACPAPHAGEATCFALVRRPAAASEAASPGVHPFTLNAGAASSGPAGGLTPAQLASAYGYDPAAGGTGQTLAIVDAFDDPNIEADLQAFDAEYGLAACTHANGCFTKVGQSGSAESLPAADTSGWSVEITLDVEAAHAACGSCKLLLVEANSSHFTDLAEAVNEAVKLGANEVSNSYGGPEGKFSLESAYNHPGVVIAASDGDSGWDSWTRFNEGVVPPVPPRPNVPSSLPTVVSVGGTSLQLGAGGQRASETVWNGNGAGDAAENEGASGGGCSTVFSAQPWQQNAPGYGAAGCAGTRLAADVAAVADPLTGFDIYDTYNCGPLCEASRRGKSWLTIGGTSLSTPLVSAMYALAGGADGMQYPALTLYGHLGGGALYDVTQGGNGYCDSSGEACGINAVLAKLALEEFPELIGVKLDCEGTTACNAAPGFDGPSGVGAPASLSLFEPLHPTGAIAPPAKVFAKTPAAFATTAVSDPYPGATIGYSWNWGDGTAPGSGATPSHTWAAPGEYLLTLTLTDSYGLKSTPATTHVKVVERTAEEIKEEEAAKKRAEEEAAKKKAAEEAASKKAEEEAAKRKAEEEAAARTAVTNGLSGQGVQSFKAAKPNALLVAGALQATPAGIVTLVIGCPAGETTCEGTVTLRTLGAVSAAGKRSVLTLASGHFKVAGGKTAAIKLHLGVKARRLLARKHSLRVRVQIAAHDPAGATSAASSTVTLRAGRNHH
ncbi:MAG: PKD domain-containing protein [Solirubrobacteraceae bacterium]